MCGKCMLHRNETTNTMTYSEKPHHASVTMATSNKHHRASSGSFYSQNSLPHNTKQHGKLNQAKSKVSSLFKGSHGSHFYEPAGYRYKRLRTTEKNESQHTNYEPEWTSIGAFLNRRPSSYGSTRESKEKFVDRYGRRSRDSLDADDEVVEYALKLRPRRRQMIELQEFPLGFSKSYLNIDLESDPGVVFDPCRDQLRRKKTKASGRLTFSDSDLRKLSCMDKLGTYNDSENLFDGGKKRRKSSLKTGSRKGKSNAKVVTFFPSNLSYDAQFVQILPRDKMAETKEGEFEKRFISLHREPQNSLSRIDTKATPSLNQTKAGFNDLRKIAGNTKDEFPFTDSQKAKTKEHAIDCDMNVQSFYMEDKRDEMLQTRDCASSYINYGCRSSTEVLTESKEKLTGNFESLSSSFSDLQKSDRVYKPEPLAGLLSPVRRASPKRGTRKDIVTSQAAGDLVCVSSYVQPLSLGSPKRAASNGCNIYQPQLDDTRPFQSHKSQSDFEQEMLRMEKTSCYDSLQQYPEKETRTES
ncbi:hypothetical protein AWC38_SpisGene17432 [Stylophora pistillata]|uniref:Uncharacterized protein n=2 Tax=Stylophora pistillata TaxID=50429 RepID=A0A2B4RPP2_STYPI|nr:hypothetical protein AWC38_SpisGene17432 [Stylophora pistillata]